MKMMGTIEIGLIYSTRLMGSQPSWLLDNSSIETYGSSWNDFGYELIYRIDEIKAPATVINELKQGFEAAFGLAADRYRYNPTFWRVYWGNGQLRLDSLKKCEHSLDEIARQHKVAFKLKDVVIQPRPMGYIRHYIEQY